MRGHTRAWPHSIEHLLGNARRHGVRRALVEARIDDARHRFPRDVARALVFLVSLLAAEMNLLEERVVEALDDDRKDLVLGANRPGAQSEHSSGHCNKRKP